MILFVMGNMIRHILAVFIFLLLLGCQPDGQKTDIGFMGTLSGRYADVGQDSLKGAMLAIDDSGSASSVNLVIKDDMGSPEEGMRLIQDFDAKKISYIIGPNLSIVASNVVPYLKDKYMFMLSPSVSTSELAGKDDHFIRTMPHNTKRQAENISKYLTEKLGIKDMVIVYDSRNSTYANDIVKLVTDSFMGRGGVIRDLRPFNPDSGESMSKLIEKDKDNPPQLYYIIASSVDSSMILWQIKKAGYKSKILIRGWALSNDLFRYGGAAAEGVYLFDYYLDKTSKAYTQFAKEYEQKYKKEPSWMSVQGYESTKMLISALPSLNKGVGFYDAVSAQSKNAKLLTGFSFDEYGDAYLPLNFFVIKNGKAVRQGEAE